MEKDIKDITRSFKPLLDPVHPDITAYLQELNGFQRGDPILDEMDEYAREHSFPIIGRLVGEFIKTLTLISGARTVFEFGSGFGYSAYYFASALPDSGRVICSDANPDNEKRARKYLARAGLAEKVEFHTGMAQDIFRATPGDFDIIYNDVDKGFYPEIFRMARERLKPGGLYIADNTLWFGNVTVENPPVDIEEGWTQSIKLHNKLIADDKNFDFFLNPVRDGVIVGRKRG